MARAKHPAQYSMQIGGLFCVKEPGNFVHVRNKDEVLEVCKDMSDKDQEMFCVLSLNAKNNIIDRHLVSLGIADATLVHPREVYRAAIKDGACAIVVVHNHPTGGTSPSAEDIRITRQLIEAGKILDIKLLDSCIIGRNKDGEATVLSMREEGTVTFN